MILVSVIVPIYKAELWLHRCLDSLLAQTLENFEIILVDDGSPDRCGIICDEYAKRDSRIHVIHQQNAGVSVARQIGVDTSVGEYVIHADPDDWMEPEMLEELYIKAKKEDADMVICDYINEFTEYSKYCYQRPPVEDAQSVLKALLFQQLHGSCCNKLVKRVCYNLPDVKFPQNLSLCEDSFINCQILSHNIKVCYLNKAFYHYDQYTNIYSLCKTEKSYPWALFVELMNDKFGTEDFDYLYAHKKAVLTEFFLDGHIEEMQKLYPEIHNRIIEEGKKFHLFSPNSNCLSLALRGKPRIAKKIHQVWMEFIKMKEYVQRRFKWARW